MKGDRHMQPRRDEGFALVAAVAGMAVFAFLAFEILDGSRGVVALEQARQDQAVLAAAADAGLAQAIYNLALANRNQQVSVDGVPRRSDFDGAQLTITVSDERGKIAINKASSDVERRLFTAAGVDGDRLDILVDSLDDWKDGDNTSRPHGAEAPYYLPHGYRPRNGAIRTIGELAEIRGMDADLLARIAPAITFFPGNGGFNGETAPLLALEAMQGAVGSAFDIQKRQMELSGERTALDIASNQPLTGRILSVAVRAQLADGARFDRRWVVEFTGNPMQPYWIRHVY